MIFNLHYTFLQSGSGILYKEGVEEADIDSFGTFLWLDIINGLHAFSRK